MKSKLIIGIPLAAITLGLVYNYFNTPAVSFANIRGHYMTLGGPYEGCAVLLQPGASVKVNGSFGLYETQTPDLVGEVNGNMFSFKYTMVDGQTGTAALLVSPTDLKGEWNSSTSESGTWSWTKMKDGCPS